MPKIKYGFFLTLILCATGAGAAAAFATVLRPESLIQRRWAAMQVLDKQLVEDDSINAAEHAHTIGEFYRSKFSGYLAPGNLARMTDGDIIALMQAAQRAAFYTHDDVQVNDALAVLDHAKKRGIATGSDAGETYRLLVTNRRFEDAEELADEFPTLHVPMLPRLVGIHPDWQGPAEMRVGDLEGTLMWVPVEFESFPRILVIAHPLCHFTQNAVRAIESDPELKVLFTAHSKWLAPQDQTTDFSIFREWNAQHPWASITIAYRAAAFPKIEEWATPTFYIIEHSKVTARIEGWPENGRRDEILAAYRAAFYAPEPSNVR